MPSCSICGRSSPTARHVEGTTWVCPAYRDTDCYEIADEQAARKWMNEVQDVEIEAEAETEVA